MQLCIFCETEIPDPTPSGPDRYRYICARCGTFDVSGTVQVTAPAKLASDRNLRFVTSHVVRRMQRLGSEPPFIKDDLLLRIWAESKLPTPVEQLEALLELVGDQQPNPADYVDLDIPCIAGIIGTGDDTSHNEWPGFDYVREHASTNGWLELRESPRFPKLSAGQLGVRLTFEGWIKYDQIKHRPTAARLAFMAMKFGDAVLDRVYQDCFKIAVERTGFELRRLDENQPAGLIDNQMRVAIRTARFLIADLTHGNQGAYWEAGFAEGLDRPVIYTCEKNLFSAAKTHFDTNHHVTIAWDISDLPAAADALAATIRNTLPGEAKLTDE